MPAGYQHLLHPLPDPGRPTGDRTRKKTHVRQPPAKRLVSNTLRIFLPVSGYGPILGFGGLLANRLATFVTDELIYVKKKNIKS